jgi:signal transduction histidine kinase
MIPAEEKPPFKSFAQDILMNDGLYHDIVINTAGGQTFIGNIGVRLLGVDGVHAHLLMLQDVTLQKKLQREILAKQVEIRAAFDELKKQNQQLRDLDLAKDRFIALTTHELRTPLSAMVASAEILKLGLYDSPEQMREFIDMIYEQGQHLQDLVNDILDFAKIQAGKMDFYIAEGDTLPLIEALVHQFANMAEANAVTMKIDKPAFPAKCYFDEMRLRQVISNIVNNAIKYNRNGGTVRVFFLDHPEHLKILVQDTGKGIALEQFNKVFNEFETIGNVAQHHKGTGLGMPISHKLMEGMGGRIAFISELGKGSTFWVEIPKTKVLDESVYRPRKTGDLLAG